jgi:hypothetical protein
LTDAAPNLALVASATLLLFAECGSTSGFLKPREPPDHDDDDNDAAVDEDAAPTAAMDGADGDAITTTAAAAAEVAAAAAAARIASFFVLFCRRTACLCLGRDASDSSAMVRGR